MKKLKDILKKITKIAKYNWDGTNYMSEKHD